jgi:hypothetical protein
MTGLVIATYWWSPDAGSKFIPYTAENVRELQRAVARNLTVPHEFAVITDQPDLFNDDKDIRAITLLRDTHVPKTCFARLMTFHPKGREIIGERVLQIDLDTLICGNIDHLVSREEDLVLWRNPALHPSKPGRSRYNTSILLHKCGTMPELWHAFLELGKARIPAKDDQWYLSDALGPDMPYFDGERDGVYRVAPSPTDTRGGISGALPANACVVTFPGSNGKWTLPHIADANPWIKEHLA